MHVPPTSGAAAPAARETSPDHATVLLDLFSDLLTNLVGLAFVLYVTVGLLGVLIALVLRTRRGPSRPDPGAAA